MSFLLPIILVGYITGYGPNVAEDVMWRRAHYFGLLPRTGCLCALNSDRVGGVIYVIAPGLEPIPCHVVDVTQTLHVKAREDKNYVIELDYETFEQIVPRRVAIVTLGKVERKEKRPACETAWEQGWLANCRGGEYGTR